MGETSLNWRTAWARIARPRAFDKAVDEYERRALTQPFSDPLSYVRQFARASRSDPFRRAAWLEVERKLQASPSFAQHAISITRRLSPASLAAGFAFSSTLYAAAVATVWMLKHHHS